MGITFTVGDVHGQRQTLVRVLREARLLDARTRWVGGDATLCLVGDYTDRGPDGVGTIELVMRLQHQAAAAGGRMLALLGNHDMLLLAAHAFAQTPSSGPGGTFLSEWRFNGGQTRDLERLLPEHVAWLRGLPAMARLGPWLVVHADSPFYARLGRNVRAVNAAFAALLSQPHPTGWDEMFATWTGRRGFWGWQGKENLDRFLNFFGARGLIHGHTPIAKLTGQTPEEVQQALVYQNGRCVNVDGGLYLGGPGFVHALADPPPLD